MIDQFKNIYWLFFGGRLKLPEMIWTIDDELFPAATRVEIPGSVIQGRCFPDTQLSRPQFNKSMSPGEGEECWPANSSCRIWSNRVFRFVPLTVLTCVRNVISVLCPHWVRWELLEQPSWWLPVVQAEQDPLGLLSTSLAIINQLVLVIGGFRHLHFPQHWGWLVG